MDQQYDLNFIFEKRLGGKYNIEGIQFQIQYSIYLALSSLTDTNCQSIRLEGIEDADLLGLSSGNHYYQIKRSNSAWKWSQIKPILENFYEVFKVDSAAKFSVVFNFNTRGDLKLLAEYTTLEEKEKQSILRKYFALCKKINIPEGDAQGLLDRITIESILESELIRKTMAKITEFYHLGSEIAFTFHKVLISDFLAMAISREEISYRKLRQIGIKLEEHKVKEDHFRAVGSGLISRVNWIDAGSKDAFFEGKNAKPGDIQSGFDVRRDQWMNMIDENFDQANVCLIKASSGQGKSTLMYRYAFDKWGRDEVYTVFRADSVESAGVIRNYISFRQGLGIPILVLIDDAGVFMRYWVDILKGFDSGIVKFLVTVRNEDWFRFGTSSQFRYKVVEPFLSLEEAKEIFSSFRKEDRIHPEVNSAEWAFEKIGEPSLLMEFVYLITHGKMLKERLQDQVKTIGKLNESSEKLELLRLVSLADACNAPVEVNKIMALAAVSTDHQLLIESLEGEYISVENRHLMGLHKVRSRHLVQILHPEYIPASDTALKLIEVIPESLLGNFIASAFKLPSLDSKIFYDDLKRHANIYMPNQVIAILEGLFEVGESEYFEENKRFFDLAFDSLGPSGPSNMLAGTFPGTPIDYVESMAAMDDDPSNGFKKLRDWLSQFSNLSRGKEKCKEFLMEIETEKYIGLADQIKQVAELLNWGAFCAIDQGISTKTRKLLFSPHLFSHPVESVALFLLGVFGIDEEIYLQWYSEFEHLSLEFFRRNLRCLSLDSGQDEVFISFLVGESATEENLSANGEAINRLQILRQAFPHKKKFSSNGHYLLPLGLKPNVDDSIKEIPIEGLPTDWLVNRNVTWKEVVLSHYYLDSFYLFQRAWQEIRSNAIQTFKIFAKFIRLELGHKELSQKERKTFGELYEGLGYLLQKSPKMQEKASKASGIEINGMDSWASQVKYFLIHAIKGKKRNDDRLIHVSKNNIRRSLQLLPKMHEEFEQVYRFSPDYFEMRKLNDSEIALFGKFANLYEYWVSENPETAISNADKYIEDFLRRKESLILRGIAATIQNELGNIEVILPSQIYSDQILNYCPFYLEVQNPYDAHEDVFDLLDILRPFSDQINYFCVIPIHQGKRFMAGGYSVNLLSLPESLEVWQNHWELLVPTEIDEKVMSFLPPREYVKLPGFELWSSVWGLYLGVEYLQKVNSALSELSNQEREEYSNFYSLQKDKVNDTLNRGYDLLASISVELPVTEVLFQNVRLGIETWKNLDDLEDCLRDAIEEIQTM